MLICTWQPRRQTPLLLLQRLKQSWRLAEKKRAASWELHSSFTRPMTNLKLPARIALPQNHSKQARHPCLLTFRMCFEPALSSSFGSLCPASARFLLTITTASPQSHPQHDCPYASRFCLHGLIPLVPASSKEAGRWLRQGKVRGLWVCLCLCSC